MLFHAEIAAAVRDELVDFLEGAGVEQQLDALARGELSGVVLPLVSLGAAAQFGAALQISEGFMRIHSARCPVRGAPCRVFHAFTAWLFSQSFRNFSSPMLVSGWLNN